MFRAAKTIIIDIVNQSNKSLPRKIGTTSCLASVKQGCTNSHLLPVHNIARLGTARTKASDTTATKHATQETQQGGQVAPQSSWSHKEEKARDSAKDAGRLPETGTLRQGTYSDRTVQDQEAIPGGLMPNAQTKEKVKDGWDKTKENAHELQDSLKAGASKAKHSLKETKDDAKAGAQSVWNQTKEVAQEAWNDTKEGAQKLKDSIKEGVTSTKHSAEEAVTKTKHSMQESETGGEARADSTWEHTKEKAEEAWDKTKEKAKEAWDKTKEKASDTKETVKDTFDARKY